MLVLSRKLHESIVINGNCMITIVQVGRGRVRLGIDAPKDVSVHRLEVEVQKQKEKADGRKDV